MRASILVVALCIDGGADDGGLELRMELMFDGGLANDGVYGSLGEELQVWFGVYEKMV